MVISNKIKSLLLILTVLFFSNVTVASNSNEVETTGGGPIDTEEKIKDYIKHHLQDAHDYTFFTLGETGKHIGFPLPVILWDDGFHVFMSSRFNHGTEVAESKGNYYTINHGKIYRTNAEGHLDFDENHHPTNARPLDLSITKNVVGMIFVSVLLFFLFRSLAKNYNSKPIPTGVGRILEPLVIYVRDEIAKPNIGEKKHETYMPFLLTAFFYIWILNLMGLTPLGFNVTGNIAVTVCLALFTFFIVQFSGTKYYWKHIFWMPGVPILMKLLLIPVELLGILTKPFALLIRLFANITAGHFVVMSLIALTITMRAAFGPIAATGMSFILALFITIIEILVAFLQAYIFTMLSSLFIGMAVEEGHH